MHFFQRIHSHTHTQTIRILINWTELNWTPVSSTAHKQPQHTHSLPLLSINLIVKLIRNKTSLESFLKHPHVRSKETNTIIHHVVRIPIFLSILIVLIKQKNLHVNNVIVYNIVLFTENPSYYNFTHLVYSFLFPFFRLQSLGSALLLPYQGDCTPFVPFLEFLGHLSSCFVHTPPSNPSVRIQRHMSFSPSIITPMNLHRRLCSSALVIICFHYTLSHPLSCTLPTCIPTPRHNTKPTYIYYYKPGVSTFFISTIFPLFLENYFHHYLRLYCFVSEFRFCVSLKLYCNHHYFKFPVLTTKTKITQRINFNLHEKSAINNIFTRNHISDSMFVVLLSH